jgi:hypothetical protein
MGKPLVLRSLYAISGKEELKKYGLDNDKKVICIEELKNPFELHGKTAFHRCISPYISLLVELECLKGNEFNLELQSYECEKLGLVNAVAYGKIDKKKLLEMLYSNENDISWFVSHEKKITGQERRYSFSWNEAKAHAHTFESAINEYYCKFTINDDKFGKYFICPERKFLGYEIIIMMRRPSHDMALHDAVGIAEKYFP